MARIEIPESAGGGAPGHVAAASCVTWLGLERLSVELGWWSVSWLTRILPGSGLDGLR
jgi:hypothetical protein